MVYFNNLLNNTNKRTSGISQLEWATSGTRRRLGTQRCLRLEQVRVESGNVRNHTALFTIDLPIIKVGY